MGASKDLEILGYLAPQMTNSIVCKLTAAELSAAVKKISKGYCNCYKRGLEINLETAGEIDQRKVSCYNLYISFSEAR